MTSDELELLHLQRQLRDQEAQIRALRTGLTPREYDELSALQARADSIERKFGASGPAPKPGERPASYRRRVLQRLARHSPTFRDFDAAHADPAMLDVAEREIFKAAEQATPSATELRGRLVPHVEEDPSGRKITKFYGDNMTWMQQFMNHGAVCSIVRPGVENA